MRIRALDDIKTPLNPATLQEWEAEKGKIISNLKFASSIDLLKQDAPLNPVILECTEIQGIVIEKVIFQSLPGFYVTGNIYRPKDTSKKYPAVIQPHGHWQHGRQEIIDRARIPQRCTNFALRGMVAFIYDMIGYVDSTQLPHRYFDPEQELWNFGRFSLQMNNSVKAIDFVTSLPYVDADRIGCTGCSGGGTQTYFISAYDERVKVAAPINMASTRMQGGCICENQAFLRTDYNNIDYTMTIAPRPLFMSGSDGDWTVNSETVEFPAVEHVYSLYGAEDKYEHFYQHAPHCYNLPIRERVYDFFCRNFGIDNPLPQEVDFEIDPDILAIKDITPYVPSKWFIHSEEEIFDLAKSIITENIKKLSESDRDELVKKVFLLDKAPELDIPYQLLGDYDNETIVLGRCPEKRDDVGVAYFHCYNSAEDSLRVSALVSLLRTYPFAKMKASGKTAALCDIAVKLTGIENNHELADIDYSEIHIPGSVLADLCEY